jgi:hypothetical protein
MMNSSVSVSIWWKGFSWTLIFLLLALLLLGTGEHGWFLERILPIPAFLTVLFLALLLPPLFSSLLASRYYLAWCRAYYWMVRRLNTAPLSTGGTAVLILFVLFWYFRIQRVDSGDLLHFINFARQGEVFLVEHAPLETLIRCLVAELLHIFPRMNLEILLRILVSLYGAGYVLSVLCLTSRLNAYRELSAWLLIFTPVLSIFFGYIEIYAFPVWMQVITLLCGLLFLQGTASIALVSITFGIAVTAGFWNGIVGLGYLYLLRVAWRRGELSWSGIVEQALFVVSPLLITLALISFYSNPFAGIITRLGEPGLLIPLNQEAQLKGYHLFSEKHLADWANESILLMLVPLVVLLVRLMCNITFVVSLFRLPEFRYLVLCTVAAFIFGFLYYPVIGFPLDWDLYTFIFPSASLTGAVLMKDILYSRVWRKRFVFLLLLAAIFSAVWILQNALFWRYPIAATHIGPVVSSIVPDFYYKRMKQAFDQSFESHLYWLGERAIEESPGKYREILEFMDDWTIATLAKIPPEPFDYPGWARDFAQHPAHPEQVFVFDRYGRIFFYNGNKLKWIFAPDKLIPDEIVAGDFTPEGHALLLSSQGKIYRVQQSVYQEGIEGNVVWTNPETLNTFLPAPPKHREIEVHLVDLAIQPVTNQVCVLDNLNRVWNVDTQEMILQGEPSINLVRSLHFASNQEPLTIDVNNRLSYNSQKLEFPFKGNWFFPIVRDFRLTPDEKGIMVLDLNGNIHYSGSTVVYEDVVSPGNIIDRYIRLIHQTVEDSLLLLDNRYRLVKAEVDKGGATTREKIKGMITAGNYISAVNTLMNLWKKGTQFTALCYEILDTEIVRAVEGFPLWKPEDAINLYVDALVLREDFIILVDRWGRLVYEDGGTLFLLEGSGLDSWPRTEVRDATLAQNRVLFLTGDGSVWEYHFPQIFGQKNALFEHTPKRWGILQDYQPDTRWAAIEADVDSNTLYALSENGILLELNLEDKSLQYSGAPLFDFSLQKDERGYQIACMSRRGPLSIYESWSDSSRVVPNTDFGWDVIRDVAFASASNLLVLDEYGVIHQFPPTYTMSEKPYSYIRDVIAIRYLPEKQQLLWIRSNGEVRRLRIDNAM